MTLKEYKERKLEELFGELDFVSLYREDVDKVIEEAWELSSEAQIKKDAKTIAKLNNRR